MLDGNKREKNKGVTFGNQKEGKEMEKKSSFAYCTNK